MTSNVGCEKHYECTCWATTSCFVLSPPNITADGGGQLHHRMTSLETVFAGCCNLRLRSVVGNCASVDKYHCTGMTVSHCLSATFDLQPQAHCHGRTPASECFCGTEGTHSIVRHKLLQCWVSAQASHQHSQPFFIICTGNKAASQTKKPSLCFRPHLLQAAWPHLMLPAKLKLSLQAWRLMCQETHDMPCLNSFVIISQSPPCRVSTYHIYIPVKADIPSSCPTAATYCCTTSL